MDEARKFLRYIMPGLVFGTLTLLWLFIVDPNFKDRFLSIIKESALGAALGSLLMSGGLGYIFATIHHCVHSKCDRDILDHYPLINGINIKPDAGEVNREEALVISTALWCQMRDKKYIEDATYKKLESFGNQVHALGTVRIASFFSFVTALFIIFTILKLDIIIEAWPRFIIMYVLGIFVIFMFDHAYRRVGTFAQGVYDRIFREAYNQSSAAKSADSGLD